MFRSPLTAAILQKKIDQLDIASDWVVKSAGTWTPNGLPSPDITRQIGRRLGLTGIENHRTWQIDKKLLEKADLIIVMEVNHKETLSFEFPKIKNRVFLLTEIVKGKSYDIPNPTAPGVDANEVANELAGLISVGFVKIMDKVKTISSKNE
jgi:protein-tyrosine phosphatase